MIKRNPVVVLERLRDGLEVDEWSVEGELFCLCIRDEAVQFNRLNLWA